MVHVQRELLALLGKILVDFVFQAFMPPKQDPQAVRRAHQGRIHQIQGSLIAGTVRLELLKGLQDKVFVPTVRSVIMRIRLEARPVPGALPALQRPV